MTTSPKAQAEAMVDDIFTQGPYLISTAKRNQLVTALEKLLTENERLKFQWEHETCNHCGYMRSPVAPCKCGQLVTVGTNNFLRSQLTATEAKLETARGLLFLSTTYVAECSEISISGSSQCGASDLLPKIDAFLSTLTAAKKEEAK